jgi:hypothetical protein
VRLDDLSRPAIARLLDGEVLARIGQHPRERAFGVVLLADAVVFAADDEERAAVGLLPARVVIRIGGVPEKSVGMLAAGLERHRVRPVRRGHRMDLREAGDRNVRGHEHRLRAHEARLGDDDARRTFFHIGGKSALVNFSARRNDETRQRGEIFAGMELRLIREHHCAAGLERKRHVFAPGGVEARLARRRGFALQLRDVLALLGVEISRHAAEVAVDGVFGHQLGDLLDRGAARLRDQARVVDAVFAADVVIPRVDRLGDVRGRVSGLARGDGFFLDDGHAPSALGEQQRRGKTGDAGADDCHVDIDFSAQ